MFVSYTRASVFLFALTSVVGCSSVPNGSDVMAGAPTSCMTSPRGLYKVRSETISSTCGGVGQVIDMSLVIDEKTTVQSNCTVKSSHVSENKCTSYSSFTCNVNGQIANYDGYLDCKTSVCSTYSGEMSIKTNDCVMTVRLTYTYTR